MVFARKSDKSEEIAVSLTTSLRARQEQQEDPAKKSILRQQDPDTLTALPGTTPSPLTSSLSRARAFAAGNPAPDAAPEQKMTLAEYLAKKRQESGGLA